MSDIALEIIEQIKSQFYAVINANSRLKNKLALVNNGSTSYTDALDYADEVGDALGHAIRTVVSKDTLPDGILYYNIAQKILDGIGSDAFDMGVSVAKTVQASINHSAGIGLKALAAATKQSRISEILNKVSGREYTSSVESIFVESVHSLASSAVSDTMDANGTFQSEAGMQAVVKRTKHAGCCEYCASKPSKTSYPNPDKSIFYRHPHCRCVIEDFPGSGKSQNVHTKKWASSDKVETRKNIGNVEFAVDLAAHPGKLGAYTPTSLKAKLESSGYEVKTLGRGALKGISFEDGGGYRVNFGNDGLLQYHPEENSHHGSAYYKISTGKAGINRYDISGNEIKDG